MHEFCEISMFFDHNYNKINQEKNEKCCKLWRNNNFFGNPLDEVMKLVIKKYFRLLNSDEKKLNKVIFLETRS